MSGSTKTPEKIGILGSGQLGMMLTEAAMKLGLRVHCYSPDKQSPTGRIAVRQFISSYDDIITVAEFARTVDVVTFEFENVPSVTGETAARFVPVHPSPDVLHICQHRLREKGFLRDSGFPVPEFTVVRSVEDIEAAVRTIGLPAVIKTAGFGYDGKGQAIVRTASDIRAAWEKLNTTEAICEAFVDFEKEVSVVAARGIDGGFSHFGVIENSHANHILDVSFAPADVTDTLASEAIALARRVLETLNVVGVLCVEMFVTKSGGILINELAPRVHNSGHLTIEACASSQFEQQVRMICGLPSGDTKIRRPAAMANLLGDLWANGEPNWGALASMKDVTLHLYGKHEARPGRKMGHLTALAETTREAVAKVRAAREGIVRR